MFNWKRFVTALIIHGKFPVALVSLVLCLASNVALAESASQRGEDRARIEPRGFLYGGAIGVRREIYKDYDRRVIPLPVLGYRGEKLRVFGPFVSYEILNSGDFKFSAQARPRFGGFDESDSDIFEGMEEREFTMEIGLGLNYERDNWKFELSGLYDALDRSNGTEYSASLGKVVRVGSVFVEPRIDLSYLDSRHVDYYYGVNESEATNFRPEYEGDNAFNSSLGVSMTTMKFFDGLTRFSVDNTWFDSSITDSPLTDSDSSLSLRISFAKFF
jgi:outer membrane protein